jgi:hypothetical protein
VTFGISTDMCVSTTVRTGANMGWDMVLAADACDCFDLPDGKGGTIAAETVQAAHIATLGFEFCRVVSTRACGSLGELNTDRRMVGRLSSARAHLCTSADRSRSAARRAKQMVDAEARVSRPGSGV